MRICWGKYALKISFILCERNIISHFSALLNRDGKRERRRRSRWREEFISSPGCRLMCSWGWSEARSTRNRCWHFSLLGYRQYFPRTSSEQQHSSFRRTAASCVSLSVCAVVPVMSSTYSTAGAQLWLQSCSASDLSPWDRWHFTQLLRIESTDEN